MHLLLHVTLLSSLASSISAAIVQGTCVKHDSGLKWLANKLSSSAVISCEGSSWQQFNADRYWGTQFGKNASVVVFPTCTQDVSYTVMATHKTPLGNDFAFVSGAHGMTGAASSSGFVIDLSFMNASQVVPSFEVDGCKNGSKITAISYEGGAKWLDVTAATAGSGFTAVGARVSTVGVGGFSTGGGIGFLAGAYGYAIDRLRAMEVVLLNGDIVMATKENSYSDLFWALQGGGGQFGIVTKFYQEAALEPAGVIASVYYVDPSSSTQATQNVVDWFASNDDPFSLIYYVLGFLPADPTASNPSPDTFAIRQILACVYFPDPTGAAQKSFQDRFSPVLQDLKFDFNVTYEVPYADLTLLLDPFFPYGYRRGFYGPQTTNISTSYLGIVYDEFETYVGTILANGDFPATALWALQYMSPGLNGNLPTSPSATGWPHTIAGHQTLFSPAWLSSADDTVTAVDNENFNQLTYQQQAKVGPVIPDYPNYISPNATGSRVWGHNVRRLIQVKEKYDPNCRIHNGRVFATRACIKGGWANIYPS